MAACAGAVLIGALAGACDDGGESTIVPIPSMDGGIDGAMAPTVDAATHDGSCREPSTDDYDRDGFRSEPSGAQLVDCDDCDPLRGPDSIDVPGNGIDEDCDGTDAPTTPVPCRAEDALDPDDTSPDSVARALGLCKDGDTSSGSRYAAHWGLLVGERDKPRWRRLSDRETLADARQVWLPERFGTIAPRQGSRLVVLSTGVARDRTDDGLAAYTSGCDAFTGTRSGAGGWSGGVAPLTGFPYDSSRCPRQLVTEGTTAYDDVGFQLTVRAPMNARAFAFDSMFLTYEYPDHVCARFNDFFVVLMDDAPREYEHDNVLVDDAEDQNPIGVNSGLLRVCRRNDRAARDDISCELGPSLLEDTGYDRGESRCAADMTSEEDVGGAATGWLHTEVKIEPGQRVTLRFLLWDSGDPLLDSTVLLDNFRFLTTEPATIATRPVPGGP